MKICREDGNRLVEFCTIMLSLYTKHTRSKQEVKSEICEKWPSNSSEPQVRPELEQKGCENHLLNWILLFYAWTDMCQVCTRFPLDFMKFYSSWLCSIGMSHSLLDKNFICSNKHAILLFWALETILYWMDALLTNSGEVSIHFDQVISELQRRVGPIHTPNSDCNKFVKIGRKIK